MAKKYDPRRDPQGLKMVICSDRFENGDLTFREFVSFVQIDLKMTNRRLDRFENSDLAVCEFFWLSVNYSWFVLHLS